MESKIEKRLTRQLVGKKIKNAKDMAHSLLVKRGIITEDGSLTKKGEKRNSMTPEERAKDRASKYSGKNKPKDYKYNKNTNRATLKRKV